MKKLILVLLTLLSTISLFADNKSLIITFNDGTTQAFALAELPDILMENDKMIINAGNNTIEYDLYKVKTFTFGIPSGIDNTTIQDVLMNGNKLYIPGTNNKIRIFSIDGTSVKLPNIQTGNANVLDLDPLPKSVYIINVNGKSDGVIPLSEFKGHGDIKVGDTVRVKYENMELEPPVSVVRALSNIFGVSYDCIIDNHLASELNDADKERLSVIEHSFSKLKEHEKIAVTEMARIMAQA